MNAGLLRHFVHLQKPVETQALDGGVDRTWTTVRTIWVELRALSGTEFWQAAAVQSSTMYRVRCRALDTTDVTTAWRLRTEDGRVLQVTARLADDRDRATTWLLCGESGSEAA